MRLRLPYPPTANLYWRSFRGRVVKSSEARAYQKLAAMYALAEGMRPTAAPVAVILEVYRPRKQGDLDNTLKVLLDALKGVAYVDDAQVVELHAFRHDDKADPRAMVSIDEVCR